ncbi:WD repeat-containing protein 74-like [Liolophura sinensis]|uniref:WD repeat-containing protein 74-like n=1 Tax=Liolophura sinensis TaxID=3198878 RepID=UPI0031597C57
MANTCFHNVYVGSETGLLKGVHVEKNAWNNVNTVEKLDKNNEICCMCWGNHEQTEVCFGTKSQFVHSYNIDSGEWNETETCSGGSGKFCGLSKYEKHYLTAVESGLVKVWHENTDDVVEIDAGAELCCMCHSEQNPHLVATGGKENDFKLWDLSNAKQPIFKAKNVRNDWLNLRAPVWVLGIQFIPDSQKVITCTGYHQVRIYDPSSPQRRPVMEMTFDEYPLSAMTIRPQGTQVIVGNTQGKMGMMDLRKGQMVQCYKGFAGGIRSLQCHPTMPLVASCGLDRFLRIHHIDSGHLLHKIYLKSRLNCLLFASKWNPDVTTMTDENKADVKEKQVDVMDEGDSDNEDELWAKMEAVKTKTVLKHKADKHITQRETKVNIHQKEPVKRPHSSENKTKPNKKRNKKHV